MSVSHGLVQGELHCCAGCCKHHCKCAVHWPWAATDRWLQGCDNAAQFLWPGSIKRVVLKMLDCHHLLWCLYGFITNWLGLHMHLSPSSTLRLLGMFRAPSSSFALSVACRYVMHLVFVDVGVIACMAHTARPASLYMASHACTLTRGSLW